VKKICSKSGASFLINLKNQEFSFNSIFILGKQKEKKEKFRDDYDPD
jgi:hypothetical protein